MLQLRPSASKQKIYIFKTLLSIVEYWLFYCNHIMHWCNSDRLYFLGLQNHNGDYSHEIKRCLLLGRKTMTKLDSILKSRDIVLLTKFHIVKAMVFPVVMYGCESWSIKEGWALKNWCYWTVVLEKTLESLLDSKEIKRVNPKGNLPWILIGRTDTKAEAQILWSPDVKSQLIRKDSGAGKDWRQKKNLRWLDSTTNSMDMNLSKLQERVKKREIWVLQSMGSQELVRSTEWLNSNKM